MKKVVSLSLKVTKYWKQIVVFGRIEDTINCFWDFLTFNIHYNENYKKCEFIDPQDLFYYLWEYLLTLFTVDLGMRNRLSFMCVASPMVRIWYDVLAPSSWRAHIIWNHDVHCNQTKLYFWCILVWVRLWSFHLQYLELTQFDCLIWIQRNGTLQLACPHNLKSWRAL
mgnify:CR=1 FL=1